VVLGGHVQLLGVLRQDAVLYRDILLQQMVEPVVQDFGLSW
jgi:hypothetical protein